MQTCWTRLMTAAVPISRARKLSFVRVTRYLARIRHSASCLCTTFNFRAFASTGKICSESSIGECDRAARFSETRLVQTDQLLSIADIVQVKTLQAKLTSNGAEGSLCGH